MHPRLSVAAQHDLSGQFSRREPARPEHAAQAADQFVLRGFQYERVAGIYEVDFFVLVLAGLALRQRRVAQPGFAAGFGIGACPKTEMEKSKRKNAERA